MRLAHHLTRRENGVFCFRLVIPADLRSHLAEAVAARPEAANWKQRLEDVDDGIESTSAGIVRAKANREYHEQCAGQWRHEHPWRAFTGLGCKELRGRLGKAKTEAEAEVRREQRLKWLQQERSQAEADRATLEPKQRMVAAAEKELDDATAAAKRVLVDDKRWLDDKRKPLEAEQRDPVAAVAAREAQARQKALEAQQRVLDEAQRKQQAQQQRLKRLPPGLKPKPPGYDRGGGMSL